MEKIDRHPLTRRDPLTRRRILEAALALVEREGATALTMRRLATELGAGAMSVYHYVPSRDDLLDGLAETMFGRIDMESSALEWQDVLRRFMTGIRAVAQAYPEAFRLVGMRPLRTVEALRPIEGALSAMRAGGFDDRAAVYAYRASVAYARGYALAEMHGFTLESPGRDEGKHLTMLDAGSDEFPTIAGIATRLEGFDRDAAFTFGIDALLAGLETLLGSPADGRP